jgi:hypothetical protein
LCAKKSHINTRRLKTKTIQIWKSLNATGTVRNFELLNIHISDLDPNPDPDSGRQVITDSSGIENQNWYKQQILWEEEISAMILLAT